MFFFGSNLEHQACKDATIKTDFSFLLLKGYFQYSFCWSEECKNKEKTTCYALSNYEFLTIFCCIFLLNYRVNTTPNSGKKRRMDCMENDLLDSAER